MFFLRPAVLTAFFLANVSFFSFANPRVPVLVHLGRPSDLLPDNTITIGYTPFPDQPKTTVLSDDGHAFKEVDLYGNHHIATTLYVHSPEGKDSIITMKYIYGDDHYKWISENLLFLRVWWGRHWGGDYIYNADTCGFIYSEGFAEPRRRSPGH